MASYGWNPGMPRDVKVKGLRLKSPIGKNVNHPGGCGC